MTTEKERVKRVNIGHPICRIVSLRDFQGYDLAAYILQNRSFRRFDLIYSRSRCASAGTKKVPRPGEPRGFSRTILGSEVYRSTIQLVNKIVASLPLVPASKTSWRRDETGRIL